MVSEGCKPYLLFVDSHSGPVLAPSTLGFLGDDVGSDRDTVSERHHQLPVIHRHGGRRDGVIRNRSLDRWERVRVGTGKIGGGS